MDNKRETVYLIYSTKDGYSPSQCGSILLSTGGINLSINEFYYWYHRLHKSGYNPCVFIGWF